MSDPDEPIYSAAMGGSNESGGDAGTAASDYWLNLHRLQGCCGYQLPAGDFCIVVWLQRRRAADCERTPDLSARANGQPAARYIFVKQIAAAHGIHGIPIIADVARHAIVCRGSRSTVTLAGVVYAFIVELMRAGFADVFGII